MRLRHLVAALGAATLIAGLTASPAAAGTGVSTNCSDGHGYREVPILTSPITLGIEIENAPSTGNQKLWLCYSPTAVGEPGSITGGTITVDIYPSVSTASPGLGLLVICTPDFTTGIGSTCFAPISVTITHGVSTPASPVCLLSSGSGCLAYLPGIKLVTGAAPLLSLNLLGVPLNVTLPLPPQCIAAVVTCP